MVQVPISIWDRMSRLIQSGERQRLRQTPLRALSRREERMKRVIRAIIAAGLVLGLMIAVSSAAGSATA